LLLQVLRRAALGFVVLHCLGEPPDDVLESGAFADGLPQHEKVGTQFDKGDRLPDGWWRTGPATPWEATVFTGSRTAWRTYADRADTNPYYKGRCR
jgi:hypothetical protein